MRLWLLSVLASLVLATDGRAQDAPPAPAPPAPAPSAWIAKAAASIQALDKINARATVLTIKAGQSASFESLTIAVKGCVVRPPDVPADAAAFLTITDKNPDAPGFTGWMLKSAPAVSMLAHPIYDIRVLGCSG
jgi:hypothetical protein